MEPSASPSRAESRAVFIADDDPDLRLLLKLLIQGEPGLCVSGEAGSGCDAVEAIDHGCAADILLVDVNMPRMDVRDSLRRLRRTHPDMEVVVYSGEDEPVGRARIGDIGPFTYVVKGRPERLLAALREPGQRGA